jgi:hypothetical protein
LPIQAYWRLFAQNNYWPNVDIPNTTASNIEGSHVNTKLKQETREDTRPPSAIDRVPGQPGGALQKDEHGRIEKR